MVTNNIVGRFTGPPFPPDGGESRAIPNGPIFTADEVIQWLEDPETKAIAVTQRCRNDLQQLEFDSVDIKKLITNAITSGRYIASEWAQPSNTKWMGCDSYEVSQEEFVPTAHRKMLVNYYLKFSLASTGNIIFTVSCHVPSK